MEDRRASSVWMVMGEHPFGTGVIDRPLTAREQEVVQLAADGHSAREIAAVLVLSPCTVKTHFQNVYAKLGVPDRASAVAHCLRRGVIQ